MSSVYFDVYRRGGVATTAELLRDGHTPYRLRLAVRAREVVRVRQGHYACPELNAARQQAYRVGGRLSGAAAARAHGIWVPVGNHPLDIQVRPDARALRTRTDPKKRLNVNPDAGARVHWTDRRAPGTRSLVGPVACLATLLAQLPLREGFASAESALHKTIIRPGEWQRLLLAMPQGVRAALEDVGSASESGGESLLLYDLRRAGLSFRQQVTIVGVGRVDFMIGERLIVEVDGAEFHTSPQDFEEDRRRDAVLSTLGYRVLRFSHRQLERHDPVVLASIHAALARGDHE